MLFVINLRASPLSFITFMEEEPHDPKAPIVQHFDEVPTVRHYDEVPIVQHHDKVLPVQHLPEVPTGRAQILHAEWLRPQSTRRNKEEPKPTAWLLCDQCDYRTNTLKPEKAQSRLLTHKMCNLSLR